MYLKHKMKSPNKQSMWALYSCYFDTDGAVSFRRTVCWHAILVTLTQIVLFHVEELCVWALYSCYFNTDGAVSFRRSVASPSAATIIIPTVVSVFVVSVFILLAVFILRCRKLSSQLQQTYVSSDSQALRCEFMSFHPLDLFLFVFIIDLHELHTL